MLQEIRAFSLIYFFYPAKVVVLTMVVVRENFKTNGIKIEPLHESPNEYVVQDLHVGDTYHVPGDGRSEGFKINGKLVLKAGQSVVINTEERIVIDDQKIFGQLTSKASWIAQGILIANTKIDPMFGVGTPNAHLKVLVHNTSSEPFSVERGMSFCSVYFLVLEQPISVKHARNAPPWPSQPRSTTSRFFSNNKIHIVALLTAVIGSIVGGVVGAYAQRYFSSR